MKYLISGGGTGGHIFPAVSIANALRELDPEAEILFIILFIPGVILYAIWSTIARHGSIISSARLKEL